ncbi:hypothetical protein PG991_013608 [Apiospora marii]|uniref:Uncharacterized protein n=1 Tax=Apiospora marii TaxID=335849 RepID=A0ABR1R6I2_9PEZI
MHQPNKPDQTLVDPNLWAKFYGTDSWATSNDASGNQWRNDCDYAQVNIRKWAERFCEDRDKRSCSFDGSCKENLDADDDGGFFSREEEMPDAPPLNEGETFGTKGFKKPAWEFSRMPAPIKGTAAKSSIRNPFAPASPTVLNEVKKKGVTWQQDLTGGGSSNGGLFTPKEIPQQQSPLYQPPRPTSHPQSQPQTHTQTHQPLQTKPQASPKPSLKSPSADKGWLEPSQKIPMDTSFLDDDLNKPDPPPVPADGNSIGGFVNLDQDRAWSRPQKPLTDAEMEKIWGPGSGPMMAGLKGGGPPDGARYRDHPEMMEELVRRGQEFEMERYNSAIEGRPRRFDMSSPLNMTPREFEQHVAELEKTIALEDAQAEAAGPYSSSSTAAAAAAATATNGKATTSTSAAASSPITRQPPTGYSRPSVSSQGGNNNKRPHTATTDAPAPASPAMRQPPTGYSRPSISSQASNDKQRTYKPTAAAAPVPSAPPQPGSATKRRLFGLGDLDPEMNIAFYEQHRPGGSARDEAERMTYNAFLGFGNKKATSQSPSLGGAQFESARQRSFEQQQQDMTQPPYQRSSNDVMAATFAATQRHFTKGTTFQGAAMPTREQQQGQHRDAGRAVAQRFYPSSPAPEGAAGERPAKRKSNDGFANPVPYRKNNNSNFSLRGGGSAGSSASDTSSGDEGSVSPLYRDEAAVAGMSLTSEVAIEKARHAIRHAGPKVTQQDDEVMQDADQPSSGQYVDTSS